MEEKKENPTLKMFRDMLMHYINKLDNGECNEDDINYIIEHTYASANGYYNDESFLNYDQAMKILGIKSRNAFKELMDLHGIKSHKINNMSVGFPKEKILALSVKLKKGAEDKRNRL